MSAWKEIEKYKREASSGIPPKNAKAFDATEGDGVVNLTFTLPDDTVVENNLLCTVAGAMVRKSTTGYPVNEYDGDLVVDISSEDMTKYETEPYADRDVSNDTTYYYSLFPKSDHNVYNRTNATKVIATPHKFRASIEVTYPAGSTCTCVNGDTFLEATDKSGSFTFSVNAPGVWKVKITNDEDVNEKSVTITDDGQQEQITLAYVSAHIIVNYPTGATCTATLGSEVITAGDKTGTHTFVVSTKGNWTIKATLGDQSVEDYVNVTEVSEIPPEHNVTLAFFLASITVTFPVGSTCTLHKGDTLIGTATISPNTFKVTSEGEYEAKIVSGSETAKTTVIIEKNGDTKNVSLSFVNIYSVSRPVNSSGPTWTRGDDAVGLSATASIGTSAGRSSFDNLYPWSDMKRETLSTGDVMVKIPEFYYKREVSGGTEKISIATAAAAGFTKHPGSGCYIGAYKTSSNNKSVKSAAPTVSATRATFRTNAKNKGAGWCQADAAVWSAVQMLFLVEFANNNGQAVLGRGYCDSNSAALSSGSCDSVPNLTGRPAGTDGKTDVVYRGIEGIWGNIWEWVDGFNVNNGAYYVCTDPSKYADDTATGYTQLNYSGLTNWSSSYITEEGCDAANPWAMAPKTAGSGSETTHYCDCAWSSTGWRVVSRGGIWGDASKCGLWAFYASTASSNASTSVGSRLRFIPS